jgi:hypothetical protein
MTEENASYHAASLFGVPENCDRHFCARASDSRNPFNLHSLPFLPRTEHLVLLNLIYPRKTYRRDNYTQPHKTSHNLSPNSCGQVLFIFL